MTDDSHSAWILATGPEAARPVWPWLPPPDLVICADGGLDHALRLGLIPTLVVGDLDSVSPAGLATVEAGSAVPIRRYVHEIKAETDTELAVLAALELGATRLVLTGALGGRWDHSLANIGLLAHPRLVGRDVRIVTADTEIWLLRGPAGTAIYGAPGDLVSLLAQTPRVTGITTTNLVYPLTGEPLRLGLGRGISNEIAVAPAGVALDAGDLLVVVTHREA